MYKNDYETGNRFCNKVEGKEFEVLEASSEHEVRGVTD